MPDASPTAAERLPYHGPCFICGPENPSGMGLDWFRRDGRIHSRFRFETPQQGPLDHAHGGAAAAVMDEAMGAAVWVSGKQALAAKLSVDFLRPMPLGVEVDVEAWVAGAEGRKAHARALLTRVDTGEVLARASGLFVAVPEFFAREDGGWKEVPGDGR